jgi:glycosyltransferase involved in cell wall biosynthesis
VATPLAAAGLAVRDGYDIVLADSPGALAAAVAALLDDPPRAAQIAEHAARTLHERYVQNAVEPLICNLVDGELVDRDQAVSKEPT